jgi:hypothetical protein
MFRPPFAGRTATRLPHYNDRMSQEGAPKSAYELAMERLRKKDEAAGVVQTPLTDAQKTAIAEIRSLYGAKLAQADLEHQDRLRVIFDSAVRDALEVEYQRERERLTGEMDAKVEKARR